MTRNRDTEGRTVPPTTGRAPGGSTEGERPADTRGSFKGQLSEVRARTAEYTDPAAAYAAGYVVPGVDDIIPLDDVVDEAHAVCGMGFQFLKRGFFDGVDPTEPTDATEPAVLVYGEDDGDLVLGAVEYLVPKAGPYVSTPPDLFDLDEDAPWREDDPAEGLWSLHVWAHAHNPAGVFNRTNPRPQFSPDGCQDDRPPEVSG